MVADASLDMSLDDLIKKNRNSGGGNFRGRGRGAVPGPVRRNSNRPASRSAPYSTPKDVAWDHDMFVAAQPIPFPGQFSGGGGRASSIETGTKLYISNLEYGVSNEDIKELFAEVGDLKRYSIHYDRSGRSKGTAEVVFSRRQDAISAVKRYNNVQLDGKPMKIEMVGTNIVTPPPVQPAFGGAFGAFSVIPRSGPGRGDVFGRPRGGRGRGGQGGFRGRGRGQGRGRGGEKISAEDLDAELEKYHSESMQEN
ncbi:unnamed protein product [Cuscuta epithymum]|uniref:RRM domain-containing protein n=1 Tax=Cuscuta epithymum TaxID=186058 RepID=A0AAV0GJG2_9ASTE|nr:unnamed protein product [Cuscuta epithymum]CAH9147328.1 unnamed protein product [Cuscuta epithymum]